ncbi:MAG: helicase-related protein, partial [Patescibacteria group bacterium]|nr:helicase-related protein [Patescibacteria group bacterium]
SDVSLLHSLEQEFEFVETDDQIRSLSEIFHDLGSATPMDRLLVGDVGFGKTEVAIRTAFWVAVGGGQVALLAPTTILVEQHYHVFKTRMEKFGVRVRVLSRFLGKTQTEKVIEEIKKGKIDVVIGTHRLLSKDIEFSNLKYLIIDEEQRFGVKQKERFKGMRIDLHVLSMSATPIPRTLNMALSGVRDISIISTPPQGRVAIKNYVQRFDWPVVEKAILKEKSRGGQVYYVHNRVSTIEHIRQKLEERLPGVKFAVGHGQMPPGHLSKVMRDFNNCEYDVLICSTIIENGLDMPNVNTLIIDRAEMFGLSQLYQLRGRIGRSPRQAYAYFLYGGKGYAKVVLQAGRERKESGDVGDDTDGVLWDQARSRLDAIGHLNKLGSGFELAQRDLEIRGAGNFLGREQHGNVSSIGFSLYCRLLSEMIDIIKKQ